MKPINKIIIGLTGGIATGKSTVSNILKAKGFKIIDADEIAKDLMKKDNISYNKTLKQFSDRILKKDGEINRQVLGEIVFGDSKLLKRLNSITHPHIFDEIKKQIQNSNEEIIFLDIPLLFEEYDSILKWDIKLDETWLVFTDRETQIDRVIDRDNLTRPEAIKRIDSQLSIEKKRIMADKTICNLKSIEDLENKIDSLIKNLS